MVESAASLTTTYRRPLQDGMGRHVSPRTPPRNALGVVAPHLHHVYDLRYIDSVILRDRDTTVGGDGVMDERLYYAQDAQFNVTALVDTTGGVVERYAYTPYGERAVFTASWTPLTATLFDNAVSYTGQGLDAESSLHHFHNRYYSANLGRFITRDPLGYVDGRSLYGGHFGGTQDPFGLFVVPQDGPPSLTLRDINQKLLQLATSWTNGGKPFAGAILGNALGVYQAGGRVDYSHFASVIKADEKFTNRVATHFMKGILKKEPGDYYNTTISWNDRDAISNVKNKAFEHRFSYRNAEVGADSISIDNTDVAFALFDARFGYTNASTTTGGQRVDVSKDRTPDRSSITCCFDFSTDADYQITDFYDFRHDSWKASARRASPSYNYMCILQTEGHRQPFHVDVNWYGTLSATACTKSGVGAYGWKVVHAEWQGGDYGKRPTPEEQAGLEAAKAWWRR